VNRNRAPDRSDDDLRRELLAASPAPPIHEVDWKRLRERVMRAAHARRPTRHDVAWFEVIAGWSARGVPIAATAVAAAVLTLVALPASSRAIGDAASAEEHVTIEDELIAATPAAAHPLLYAGAEPDALLEAALLYDGAEP